MSIMSLPSKSSGDEAGLFPQVGQPIEHAALPATWRTSTKQIALPEDDIERFLAEDLLVTRLNRIHNHLWMVGRLLPPRPLHVQLLMSREIVVAEQINLHLVWTAGKIFIKPLPRYLLDEAFCTAHIDSNSDIAKCARGLFYTYMALVAYESDFAIALDRGLLPNTLCWSTWHATVRRTLQKNSASERNIYRTINQRYLYGELRLSRLNTIYRWFEGDLLYGYSHETSTTLYTDFFRENFAKLTAALVYVVIVLTAMQVGLADGFLADNAAFKRACYGFTVFSMIAPLAIVAAILAVFFVVFLTHLTRTKLHQTRRFAEMGLDSKNWEAQHT